MLKEYLGPFATRAAPAVYAERVQNPPRFRTIQPGRGYAWRMSLIRASPLAYADGSEKLALRTEPICVAGGVVG